jgi:hypothetical protein
MDDKRGKNNFLGSKYLENSGKIIKNGKKNYLMLSKHKNGMTTVGKMIFWAKRTEKCKKIGKNSKNTP